MAVSSFTSLSRDNIIRLVSNPNFFVKNPSLKPHEEAIAACREAYAQSKKNSSCGCGGNTKLLTPCFEDLLTALEEFKQTNPDAVADFVRHVTGQTVGEHRINVTVYYTKNRGSAPHRYEFIA